jgi:RHS repeat-associated protein
VFLSNEHPTQVDVYFDDLKVTFAKSRVVQMDDYYPFGLTFNSYRRENSIGNNYLFEEKEIQNDLGLNLLDFEWRQYDPTIGRTTTQDPHADDYSGISPYSFLANNPINFMDPIGMDTVEAKDGKVDDWKNFNPQEDVFQLEEVEGVSADREDDAGSESGSDQSSGDDSNDADEPSSAAAVGTIAFYMESVETGIIVTVSAPVMLLTGIFVLIPNSAGDGEMEALQRMREADDQLKGGKQGRRDRTYGLPKELFDWWHNGGGKKHNGGEDIGYDEGQISPEEALEQWEDLGRPSGSKPKE